MAARAILSLLLLLASSGKGVAQQTCSLALVESLSTPRFIATADTYQILIRRHKDANPRFDELLLYDALFRALKKDALQQMNLKAVVSERMLLCDGFRVLGLSVRRENVTFTPAPKSHFGDTSTLDTKSAQGVASSGTPRTIPLKSDESVEQLVELWQSGKASIEQLQQLWSLAASRGDREIQDQVFKDIAESMRKDKLPALSLEKFEFQNDSLPRIQLEPAAEKKSN